MHTFRDDPKIGSKVPMIKTADLNEQCVTNSKILDGCITKEKLAKGTVDAATLANKSVSTEKLSDSSVTNEKISNKAVSTEKLADGSITKEKIFNASITTEKLANESVSAEKLQSGLRNTIASTYDKTIELDNQKANIADVGNAIERLENKIGERILVEGDVTNLPDEEDLTSVNTIDGREVMKLNDRAYEPSNFSGKGYKILRKNIKKFDIPTVNIVVSYAPTSSGDITITVNDKVTTIKLDSTTDTTPVIVATKIAAALKSSLDDYDVSVFSNRITLIRCNDSSVSPSLISVGNTSAVISVTDGINKNVRKNVLTRDMINDPNTVYEIRYDFDLNGKDINIQRYDILFFNGGSLSNGTIKGNQSKIVSKDLTIFKNKIICSGEWENESVYSEWFDKSYTDFRFICTNLIALCKEFGSVIIERDTSLKASNSQISLSKGINFDFKNTTLKLEEQTVTESDSMPMNYIFMSNRQDKILQNLRFANLNIKAVANLQESGQFAGKTSGWGFIYISNVDNCTFENITFEHMGTGFKVGFLNGNNLGRKNIKFYRCTFTGKMLIQLFTVDNISIEDCVFDLSDADNKYDHCLYLVHNNNVSIKNCVFKNAPSAINIWNAKEQVLKDDVINVSIKHSKVINSSFLNLKSANNINIDSVYIENTLNISEYKEYTLCNIHSSKNIIINNVYCNQDKLALRNVINDSDNITYKNTCLNVYVFIFSNINSVLNILDSQFSIKAYIPNSRLINSSGTSRVRVCNCIFDINDTNIKESILIEDNSYFLLENCNMLATGGNKNTLLLRLPTSKNVFIRNSYIEFKLILLNIDQNPVVLNCKNENGRIPDFPYIKYADKSTIDKLINYLSQNDAGFTTFDSTNKECLLWNGTGWIKINGDSVDAKSNGTSVQRPIEVREGFLYYDTTLKKYIVWNGTEWTNMDGTALS